ncbi:MAG: hypothetical protein AAFQ04_09350 [Pseudomonadota bacterium]
MIPADFLPVIKGVHLLSVLFCLSLVMYADLRASKLLFTPLVKQDFRVFENCHRTLNIGLILLWITGVIITVEIIKYSLGNMSPKLFAKITVVTILTANAGMIGRFVLPHLKLHRGMMMGDFDPHIRVWLGITFAASFASWIAAFCLGMFPVFKTLDAQQLLLVIGVWYTVMLGVGLSMAAIAPRLNQSERVHLQSWNRRTSSIRENCASRMNGRAPLWPAKNAAHAT